MNGKITVDSRPGKGSVFRVDFPVDLVAENEIFGTDAFQTSEVIALEAGQPVYRILIAEDQPENAKLLIRLMGTISQDVRVAENGKECIDLFQSWSPDLIFMDNKMPVMNGSEATRMIRKLPGGEDVKIIAVTASAFREQQDEILAAGMDDIVRKPYRFEEIYNCLSHQLGLKYVYRNEQTAAPVKPSLSSDMLRSLSEELRNELKGSLQSLDAGKIRSCLQKIREIDTELAQILTGLTDRYEYPVILKALEERLS